MNQISRFEKTNTMIFPTRTRMIQFVSHYFAFQYQKELELRRVAVMSNSEEKEWWTKKLEYEVPKFEKALNEIFRIRWETCLKDTLRVKDDIWKEAAERAGIHWQGYEFFPNSHEFWVDVYQRKFTRIIHKTTK